MAMTTSKTGVPRRARAAARRACSSPRSPIRWPPIKTPRWPGALAGFDHLLKTMTAPDETAAVILEPVLGEGGYVPAPALVHGRV